MGGILGRNPPAVQGAAALIARSELFPALTARLRARIARGKYEELWAAAQVPDPE
jgi:hypothetical protein